MKKTTGIRCLLWAAVLLTAMCLCAAGSAESWYVDGDGVLFISGEGSMNSYYNDGNPGGPWGKNIRKLVIEEGITSIGTYAFYHCSELEEVSLPESLTEIGFQSFTGCSALQNVTIPSGVTEIDSFAFSDCGALKTVLLKGTLTENRAEEPERFELVFRGDASLERIDIQTDRGSCCSVDGVIYDREKTTLVLCPAGRSGTLTVPDGVKDILSCACKGCAGLTGIVLPDSLRSIGYEVFSGCAALTSASVPEGITEIPTEAFAGCSSLKSVSLPNTLSIIYIRAFAGCSGLTDVTIPNPVDVYEGAFSGCASLTAVPKNADDFNSAHVYENCTSLTSVTVPHGSISIGSWAFDGCSALKTVVFPKTLESIHDYAFRNTALTEITVYEALEELGDHAFDGYVIANVPADSTALRLFSFDSTRRIRIFDQINTVTVITDGHGKAAADPAEGKRGTLVTLSAEPDPGYRFSEWEILEGTEEIEGDRFEIGALDVRIKACFEEQPIDLADAVISKIKDQVYTGKKITPKFTVKYNGLKLTEGTDYKAVWKNNKAVGTATVTVTGMGICTGRAVQTFRINPKPTKLTRLTAGPKQLTVKWKKGSGITGYEIQYSLKKSFKGAKTVTVKNAKTVSTVLRNLKKAREYYVRIRTYKTVKGTGYYSAWSAALRQQTKEISVSPAALKTPAGTVFDGL